MAYHRVPNTQHEDSLALLLPAANARVAPRRAPRFSTALALARGDGPGDGRPATDLSIVHPHARRERVALSRRYARIRTALPAADDDRAHRELSGAALVVARAGLRAHRVHRGDGDERAAHLDWP